MTRSARLAIAKVQKLVNIYLRLKVGRTNSNFQRFQERHLGSENDRGRGPKKNKQKIWTHRD